MGPFIPKKNTVNEEGGPNRQRRRRRRTVEWNFNDFVFHEEPPPRRTRAHYGTWQSPGFHYIYCRDCDYRTNYYEEFNDMRAYDEWREHLGLAPRVEQVDY